MKLFKCECIKGNGQVPTGASVEVVNNGAYPTDENISDALERKYGLRVGSFGIVMENWEIQEV